MQPKVEILQRACENGCPWNEETCTNAAEGGHLETLKWAYMNGCEGGYFFLSAIGNGHLEILNLWLQSKIVKWARSIGYPWDEDTCTTAAGCGRIEILQWARANGCPYNEDTCAAAAKAGRLDILQWLHANDWPWDEWTCMRAAENGYLEILNLWLQSKIVQWARANDYPWDKAVCERRTRYSYILQWIEDD